MANESARRLRKRMTPQEVKLWMHLRELKGLGHHFRRQSPIPPYIVDFECRRARLIVEVDGGQHAASQQRSDAARDRFLTSSGYRVLRFWNHQIDRELEGVVTTILAVLDKPRPTWLAPNKVRREPPSPRGEGLRASRSTVPLDDGTRDALREGLAQAERGEFVSDDVVAKSDKRHGI
jgi:very-short-patch-repair endonuclease